MKPEYRIWYNKSLKSTGRPIMMENVNTGVIITTDEVNFDKVGVKVKYKNSTGKSKRCGATTIMEIYTNE